MSKKNEINQMNSRTAQLESHEPVLDFDDMEKSIQIVTGEKIDVARIHSGTGVKPPYTPGV